MNFLLLNIAVAECVYEWKYIPSPWVEGYWQDHEGEKKEVLDWAGIYKHAMDLLDDVRRVFKHRAIIETPRYDGGLWIVRLRPMRGFDAANDICHSGPTFEEAAVRSALRLVGVEVG